MLDWAAKKPGYQGQEREADRAQQVPGQQNAQREQARTRTKARAWASVGGKGLFNC